MRREDHERFLPHEVQSRRHGEDAHQGANGARLASRAKCAKRRAQPGIPNDGHALCGVPCDSSGESDVADEASPRPFVQRELDILVVELRGAHGVDRGRGVQRSYAVGEIMQRDDDSRRITSDAQYTGDTAGRLRGENALQDGGEGVDYERRKDKVLLPKRSLIVLAAQQLNGGGQTGTVLSLICHAP